MVRPNGTRWNQPPSGMPTPSPRAPSSIVMTSSTGTPWMTIQIWAALFAAAGLAALLVAAIGLAERVTLKRMGLAR